MPTFKEKVESWARRAHPLVSDQEAATMRRRFVESVPTNRDADLDACQAVARLLEDRQRLVTRFLRTRDGHPLKGAVARLKSRTGRQSVELRGQGAVIELQKAQLRRAGEVHEANRRALEGQANAIDKMQAALHHYRQALETSHQEIQRLTTLQTQLEEELGESLRVGDRLWQGHDDPDAIVAEIQRLEGGAKVIVTKTKREGPQRPAPTPVAAPAPAPAPGDITDAPF